MTYYYCWRNNTSRRPGRRTCSSTSMRIGASLTTGQCPLCSPPSPPGEDAGLTWEELAEQIAEEEIDQERQMEEDWWGKGSAAEVSWYDFLDHDPTEEDVAQERERLKGFAGYFGWFLEILGEWLANKYPWENVGDAVVFLISGRPPRLAQPLSAISNMGNATYSLTFSPWISEETLMRAYRAIRVIPHLGTRQYGSCASSQGKRTTMASSLPGPHCAIGGTWQTHTRGSRIEAPSIKPTDVL